MAEGRSAFVPGRAGAIDGQFPAKAMLPARAKGRDPQATRAIAAVAPRWTIVTATPSPGQGAGDVEFALLQDERHLVADTSRMSPPRQPVRMPMMTTMAQGCPANMAAATRQGPRPPVPQASSQTSARYRLSRRCAVKKDDDRRDSCCGDEGGFDHPEDRAVKDHVAHCAAAHCRQAGDKTKPRCRVAPRRD